MRPDSWHRECRRSGRKKNKNTTKYSKGTFNNNGPIPFTNT